MNDRRLSETLGRIDRTTWSLIAVAAVLLGIILWQRADMITGLLVSAMPWLLIMGCLLMHFFMHRGMHGNGDRDRKPRTHDDEEKLD